MPVNCSQMDYHITMPDEFLQQGFVVEEFVPERDSRHFVFLKSNVIIEVSADEAGLAGYSYVDHGL